MITYRLLFDELPVPAFVLGPLGEVMVANGPAVRLLGVPAPPEQLEQPWTLHVGERWVSLVEQIREGIEGRRSTLELLDPLAPETGRLLPLLCRPLLDGQSGGMLLCIAASELLPGQAWATELTQLHRIRIGEDPRRTLQNILLVARHALDLDRVLFIERDHPRPGQAAIRYESCRAGYDALGDSFPPVSTELYPLHWKPLHRPVALTDLSKLNLPRHVQNVLERLSARSLMVVELRPGEGPTGFMLALSCVAPRAWTDEEVHLFGRLGWAATLATEASSQLGKGQERLRWYQDLIDLGLHMPVGPRDEAAGEIAQGLLALTGARLVYVLRFAADGPEIAAHAGYGALPGEEEAEVLRQVAAKLGMEQRHTTPWSAVLPHPLVTVGPDGSGCTLSSALFLPCARSGQGLIQGLACCLSEVEPSFDEGQLAALGLLGERLALLLDEEQRQASVPTGGELSMAGLSHDFNNILGIITSYTSSAESDLEPDNPLREDLRVVLDAAEQGSSLIKRLSRAVDGEPPQPPPMDVVRTLRQVKEMLQRLLPPALQVDLATPGDLPLVRFPEADLKQAVLNLCFALEGHLPQGGLLRLLGRKVELSAQRAAELHPTARAESYLLIQVEGMGPGLSMDVLNSLLLDERPPAEGGGSTVARRSQGLAVAREMVRELGGFLIWQSPGAGSVILRLHLPLTGREALRIPSEELPVMGRQPPGAEQAPTILLVDDEPHLRNSGERNLARYGYQVLTAPDGEVGVHLYRRFLGRIDLVILDMIMPGMDGRNTFRALKAIDPSVTVVFASGFVTDPLLDELRAEGAAGFIAKPYTAKEINRTVRAVLRDRDLPPAPAGTLPPPSTDS